MRLSICMMVKDEEKNLERCLNNLKPIVDTGLAELIIVDTGSSDRTIDIAKEYTDKVYFHKWNKNFSDMRNKSIAYAAGEWILIIDADERLDNIDKMISLLDSDQLDEYNTAVVQVKNLYNYKEEDKYNTMPSPRLFRNDGSFSYTGAVHNQPICKEPTLGTEIELTHYGYISTDKELMERKYIRTVELLKNELENNPQNLYYLYQLGVSYDMHGDYKEALKEFRKAYAILKSQKLLKHKDYTYILGSHARIAYTSGEITESIKVATQAVQANPEYIDMYYILAIDEKRRSNEDEAFKYFSKYVHLVDLYGKLAISKDLTIIMYHINKESINLAYFEMTKFHMKNKDYLEAYKTYKKLTQSSSKVYCGVELLLELKKYDELNCLYFSQDDKKGENILLELLEQQLDKKEENDKTEIYKVFSGNEDQYGLYNKIKLEEDENIKSKLTEELLANLDFNKEPLFYTKALIYFKQDIDKIIEYLYPVESFNIKKIIKYVLETDKDFIEILEAYMACNKNKEENSSLEKLKVDIGILSILLLTNVEKHEIITDEYQLLFKEYIRAGLDFTKQVYQMEQAQYIYKSISTIEERFFLIIHLVEESLEKSDRKLAINYILEALNTYEAMARYIDKYKDELLLEPENKEAKEFANYKIQIKENINLLVSNGQIEDAKVLLREYQQIVPDDIDNYSMSAIIGIMEGELEQAEQVLGQGLEKQHYNQELLINMSYLMDITSRPTKAVEYFSTAKLFNPKNEVKAKEIISNLQVPNNSNLKVLHGTMEIANQMHNLTRGLKNLNVEAKTLNYYPSYLGYSSDYIIDISTYKDSEDANKACKKLASKLIAENDVFHFHFGTSLVQGYSDLALLKDLDKKVVMQYWGSEVRMYSKAIEMNPYVKVKDMNEEGIKRKLEVISKYIQNCLVEEELAEYVKDYHDKIHYTKVAMDLSKYKFLKQTNNKKMLIVHAPTSPEIKGSKYILEAVESLKEQYNFDFKLIQGMAHEEALKIYANADLIIDQILLGSHGVFAVEAMAMGKPVICWISDFMKEKYPKELPIISANPDNIKEKIEYAIKNKDMLQEIGLRGRKYAEKYHDMNKIAVDMVAIYNNL